MEYTVCFAFTEPLAMFRVAVCGRNADKLSAANGVCGAARAG